MRIDGQGATNLTNNPATDYGPCWAPTQAWVAFTTDRVGNNEVYIINTTNLELYNLTNNPNPDQVSDWR
jgi:Tol biopolymer transport system component